MEKRTTNGVAVKTIRELLGVSQKDLAARAGISPSHMARIESGLRQPSPAARRAIADVLGVSLDAITQPAKEHAPAAA